MTMGHMLDMCQVGVVYCWVIADVFKYIKTMALDNIFLKTGYRQEICGLRERERKDVRHTTYIKGKIRKYMCHSAPRELSSV